MQKQRGMMSQWIAEYVRRFVAVDIVSSFADFTNRGIRGPKTAISTLWAANLASLCHAKWLKCKKCKTTDSL
jgi:hypothetical protein